MNFLEMVNRARRECGVSRTALTTVVGATGESQRVVDSVAQAWVEIQRKHRDFKWMRRDFSFQTIAAQQAYTPSDSVPTGIALTNFRKWKEDSLRIYLTAIGATDESHLWEMNYEAFRDTYIFGAMRTATGRPDRVAFRAEDKAILLGYIPNAIYTVVGQYWIEPTVLAVDADTPAWTHDDMLVVYKAMESYGYYNAAPEVLARGKEKYGELIGMVEAEELPWFSTGGPLA